MRRTVLAIGFGLLSCACGSSRLLAAVDTRDLGGVERQLAAGDPVDARDSRGNTPLFTAASNGSRDIAAVLIAHGADVNARNAQGFTPLHGAAYWRNDDVAELLV